MLYDTKWNAKDTKSPPMFGRRWHSFSRLDIRPVLWSLRNRPEEWEQNEFTIVHKPSKHEFWIANGFWFYSLYRADCSCTKAAGGKFSYIQKVQFSFARRAVAALERARRNAELAQINVQFAEHFTQ
jgi:hypothetical protein